MVPDGRTGMKMLDQISTRIFADGADLEGILALAADLRIAGFTTNPTLMRKAGLTDYARFAQDLLERVTERPVSFEVFADDAREMRRQARAIASWGQNVYVKIPVTSTSGESMAPLARDLSEEGVKVNITALFTTAQVELIAGAVADGAPSYISVFAGRIADAGVDPVPIMARAVQIMEQAPRRARSSTWFRPTRSAATSSPSRTTCCASWMAWARASSSSRWRRSACFTTMPWLPATRYEARLHNRWRGIHRQQPR
jgi:transaldolase